MKNLEERFSGNWRNFSQLDNNFKANLKNDTSRNLKVDSKLTLYLISRCFHEYLFILSCWFFFASVIVYFMIKIFDDEVKKNWYLGRILVFCSVVVFFFWYLSSIWWGFCASLDGFIYSFVFFCFLFRKLMVFFESFLETFLLFL